MAAIAAITLANGEATPVNKTFDPQAIVNDVAFYYDRSGGIAVGFPELSLSVRPPSPQAKTRNNKVTFKVVLPVLEQVAGQASSGFTPAPTRAFDLVFLGEFILPERTTLAQRKDILAFAKNGLAHAVLQSAVHNLEMVY